MEGVSSRRDFTVMLSVLFYVHLHFKEIKARYLIIILIMIIISMHYF